MTDPKRLLLEDGSEEERRLLQAGVAEQPPADGAARLALALGAPVTSAPLPPRGAGGGPSPSPWAKLLGGKLALKAALLAGVGGAIALTLTLRSSSPAPAPTPTNTGAVSATPQAAPSGEPGANEADNAHPATSSLADEVARLDGTRRTLAAGHPDLALSMLDAYRAQHPQGTLAPEALRLRVEVWLAKGDLKRARALAREFLRTYPQSPHAATLRRIAERELNDEATEQP